MYAQEKQWSCPAHFFLGREKKPTTLPWRVKLLCVPGCISEVWVLPISPFPLGEVNSAHAPFLPSIWYRDLTAIFWSKKHVTRWPSTNLETFEMGGTGGRRLATSIQLTEGEQKGKEVTNYSPKMHLLVVTDIMACPKPARSTLESFLHRIHDQLHAYIKQDSFKWLYFPG